MSRVVGIDLGDRKSHYCVLDEDGRVFEEGSVQSTPAAFKAHFGVLESISDCDGSGRAFAVGESCAAASAVTR